MSEPIEAGVAEADAQDEGARAGRSSDQKQLTARAAAALAVTAALAALSTGVAIVVALLGGDTPSFSDDWWVSVAFVTAAIFGPAVLAALLGARALLHHRPWAPLLLLVVGTMVATAGLVILTLTVSQLSAGDSAPYHEFRFIFDQCNRESLVVVAAMAALHAFSGTLEAAAGVMGRDTGRRAQAAA